MGDCHRPDMVTVPAASFAMGTSPRHIEQLIEQSPEASLWSRFGKFSREQPTSIVHLNSYRIARDPVTVGEFATFLHDAGYQTPDFWTSSSWAWRLASARDDPAFWHRTPWTDSDRLPVVGVSWYEAVAFCRWLATTSDDPYRLPTEAEWEYAARGPNGLLYPWGDTFDPSRCNTRSSGLEHTVAVDAFGARGDSPFGLRGTVGNVSEWTSSQYRLYPYLRDDGR